jgi:ABC-2 type transport system permease protein
MDNPLIAVLRRIVNLCRKELLTVLKDPATRAILFLPVVVQSLLFGYAATYDLNNVPYALLDQSHSAPAADLIAKLDSTGVFHRVSTLRTQAEIAGVIDSEQALLAIQIGPRFEQQLHAGAGAPLQLIVDGRNSTSAAAAIADVGAVASAFNEQWREQHGGSPPALSVDARAWFNPNLETRWNLIPALIASLSMLQTLLLTALSVAREREQGTFDQLLVTPMTPLEIMVGKAVPPVMIGLIQASLVLLVAMFWFRIPMAGSLFTLYAGLAMFLLASVGIGLSISAVSANMQQAMLYTFVLVMPLMLLSGLTTPVRNMPHLLQVLTMANPLRFAIDLVQRVYLEGVGLATVYADLIPMLVIAAITLPLAAWLFRNRLA